MKFDIRELFESVSRKFGFDKNLTIITGTLHEHLCKIMVVSRGIFLRIRNVSDKSCRKIKTHILFSEHRPVMHVLNGQLPYLPPSITPLFYLTLPHISAVSTVHRQASCTSYKI